MKTNEWLTKDKFLQELIFYDKYYITTLTRHISDFLKNIPLTPATSWDFKNEQIYFMLGIMKKPFKVDINVSYWDFLYQVEQWLKPFYPQYQIEVRKERGLTEKEIIKKREFAFKHKEPFNLNELLNLSINYLEIEKAIINKIYLLKDEFVLNINGNSFLRRTGEINKPLGISDFLKHLRTLEDNLEKKTFILNSSTEIEKLKNETTYVKYPGLQMINFCKIHFEELKEFDLTQITQEVNKHLSKSKRLDYNWGNYHLKFDSELIKDDFLREYNKLNKKELEHDKN